MAKEKLKARASRKAAEEALFKERLFPHERDWRVRKGLMLSSIPEAKNSSKR